MSNHGDQDALDTLNAAATMAANWVGTDRFLRLTELSVKTHGSAIIHHMEPGERASYFTPADFKLEGKSRSGSILLLEHRAIFAWIMGLFRPKDFTAVVPYETIRNVSQTTQRASALTVELPMLLVNAHQDWSVVFNNVFEGGRSLAPVVASILQGATTFQWAEEV